MAEKAESSGEKDTSSSSIDDGAVSPPKTATSAKANPTHPSTANMVMEAIKELGERGGSSLIAIKKYIGTTYKLDPEKQATYVKKYLKNAVESGALIQTKGKGASGSFKLPSAKAQAAQLKEAKEEAEAKKPAPAKKPASKKPAKETESAQPKSPKKKQASTKGMKKDSSASEPVKSTKAAKNVPLKSPKAKKTARSPTKPKVPKAKKVTASAKSPKAATSKKTATKE